MGERTIGGMNVKTLENYLFYSTVRLLLNEIPILRTCTRELRRWIFGLRTRTLELRNRSFYLGESLLKPKKTSYSIKNIRLKKESGSLASYEPMKRTCKKYLKSFRGRISGFEAKGAGV